MIRLCGQTVPFGMNLLFCCENVDNLVLAGEICEDLWRRCHRQRSMRWQEPP